MKKLIFTLLLLNVLFLSACSINRTIGNDEFEVIEKNPLPVQELVYLTQSGTKFHRAECKYLGNYRYQVTRNAALEKGFTPCSYCMP